MNDHPYLTTWGGLGITWGLSQVSTVLSIISAVVVIVYTLTRLYFLIKNKGDK